MSFLCLDETEFKRGDRFLVVDFSDKTMKQTILAVVRYVKVNVVVGDTYVDYKVGVEFLKIATKK